MCNTRKRFLFFLALSATIISGAAQNEINSPYSGFGVGNLSLRTNNIHTAMGGIGYSLQNQYYINFKNPAAFAAFDSLSFIADFAFCLVNHQLKTDLQKQKGTFAQLDYLAVGLPVLKFWRTSAGIMPYSNIGYGMIDEHKVDTFGYVTNKYTGYGGLMLLYWGNAFRVCKGFSLGFNLSYLFGTINKENFAEYTLENSFNTIFSNYRHIDGIYFSGGAQYQIAIDEKNKIGLGALYENNFKVWSRENMIILNYFGSYAPNNYFDTVVAKIGKDAIFSSVKMPQIVGAGISYGYKEKLIAAVDFTWQNWKNFSMSNSNDSLQNNFITALGFQFVPNVASSKYYNKINFRLGTRFSTGYLIINKKPISEFAISAGLGFPVRTLTSRSSINIMFEYSKLGTLKSNLILQNYFKLSFNFILQEKWYQRTKLE